MSKVDTPIASVLMRMSICVCRPHSFIIQILMKHLECARHCAGNCGMRVDDIVSASGRLVSPGDTDNSMQTFEVQCGKRTDGGTGNCGSTW